MTRHLLLASVFLLLLTSLAAARDITLEWAPNTEPDIAGYKIYYKANSPDLPLDGKDASYTDESGVTSPADSPVDVGNKTTATLKGLDGSKIYYFSVTAYNSAGYESSFSNVVASDWVPVQTFPGNGATAPSSFQFTWSSAPRDINVTYTLYYGTDPALSTASVVPASPPGPSLPTPPIFLAPALALILILSVALARRRRLAYSTAASFLCVLTLASCGGGGGGGTQGLTSGDAFTGGDSGGSEGGVPGSPDAPFTKAIPVEKATAYSVSGLKPGITYYWKVVADDGQKVRESTIFRFTVQ